MTKNNIGKLVRHIEEEGISVGKSMRKILRFFDENILVSFSHSGFGSGVAAYVRPLSEKLKISEDNAEEALFDLKNLGILEEEKGNNSIGGSEYELGYTEEAKIIYQQKRREVS